MSSNSQRSTTDQTRTYDRASSVVFLKTHELFGGLSNMAGGFPLHVQGTRIYTSEALYQACRFPHLPEVQRLIIGQASPMTAKMKSKPYRKDSRPDWDRVRVKVMRWCLRVKLAQNSEKFSELLLRTSDRPIVEESRKDDFWGAKSADERTLVGMNVLGRLLMELREAVKSQGPQSFQVVQSPDIPEFLLFGRPIQAIGRRDFALQESVSTSAARAQDRVLVQGPAEPPLLFKASSTGDSPPPSSPAVVALESAPLSDLKPYAAMKHSGVPWLGEVPTHWTGYKLRHLLDRVAERNRPDLPLLSVVREKGVILRDISNSADNHNFIPDDLSNYKVVRRGQFAMNKMKAWQGSYGVSEHDGIVSPAYFVFTLRGAEGRFFHTAIRSRAYVPSFTQASDGVRIGQWDLSETRMREIPFFVPTLPEQSAIVRFLDHADRRIRRYIRTKQKLIMLLEEQKQAIIHRAVTRGLDPNARLKPSGVQWLGDVPAHWEVRRLKWVTRLQRGYDLPADKRSAGPFPVVSSGGIIDTHFESRVMGPGVVMGRYGSTDAVFFIDSDFWPHNTALFVTDFQKNDRRWCYYLLRTISKADHSGKSAVPGVDRKDLFEIRVAVPPFNEQQAAAIWIDEATRKLDNTLNDARRSISLVREYRTRLIADVVTGKRDVREAAARLPEEIDESEPSEVVDSEPDADEVADDLDAAPEEAEA